MLKTIKTFLFGQRAQGELIPPPKIKTFYPTQMPEENQWRQEMKFGSRYGTRGSFYQRTF
jgi:hypothetical protein